MPNTPSNEAERISTLLELDILDTERQEAFDILTRLAMNVFDVPIALVSLVDQNRQWFKSAQGLTATETSRDISFCGHAILGDESFIIADAKHDYRFCDNPLVSGDPNIRFYAGHPIKYLDGHKLGTLCIIDRKPRELTQREKLIFKDLASLVEKEIHAIEVALACDLTGIANRRGFLVNGYQMLNFAAKDHISLSLVYIDLNHFKQINEQFSRLVGDQALQFFAEALKAVSGISDIVARIDADEFVILLSGIRAHDADSVIASLKDTLHTIKQDRALPYEIDFTASVVHFDASKHAEIADMLSEASQRMTQHKQSMGVS